MRHGKLRSARHQQEVRMLARRASTLFLLTALAAPVIAASGPIAIDVDLRDAPRNLVHAKLTIPA
jgi:hypothetical protein